jgi:predicted MFS family arabinose efflux permease
MAHGAQPGALGEWRRSWRVMIPCLAGIILCSAHVATLGVMILPVEREFGWPRAQISGGLFIVSIIALFAAPFAGRAVDRIGARRVAMFGVLFYCIAFALVGAATASVFSWWGLWALLAIANMTVMPVVWLAILNSHFLASRGLAMAIALSGTGIGGAIFPYIADRLIGLIGWRGAYMAIAGIALLVVYPLVLWLFRPAGRDHARALGNDAGILRIQQPPLRGQLVSGKFLRLSAAAVIFAVAASALTTNLVPVLIGEGLTPARAAATVALMGIGSIIGRVSGGFLLDRINGSIVGMGCTLLPLIPVAIFLATDASQGWAMLACFIMGISVGAEVDCCAYLASRHFGTNNFGTLFGTINGLLLFGNGLAPVLANYGYDVMQTYDYVMMALVPLYIVSAALFLSMGRYPDEVEEAGPA